MLTSQQRISLAINLGQEPNKQLSLEYLVQLLGSSYSNIKIFALKEMCKHLQNYEAIQYILLSIDDSNEHVQKTALTIAKDKIVLTSQVLLTIARSINNSEIRYYASHSLKNQTHDSNLEQAIVLFACDPDPLISYNAIKAAKKFIIDLTKYLEMEKK